MHDEAQFWAVIPAGGAGSRLWPLSRSARPKYLLSLLGEHSLLQQTSERLESLVAQGHLMVVAGPAHAVEIGRQLPNLTSNNLIIEPFPRGTAPAISLAAMLIAQEDPTAIMGSFAADHAVTDLAAFRSALSTAIDVAGTGVLMTLGITPTRPETGYGYIECGDSALLTTDLGTAYQAISFVEKPDLATATRYIATGNYLWNASMFVWRVDAFLSELHRQQPELFAALTQIVEVWDSPERDETFARIWFELPVMTVDEGVMEHARNVAVVPVSMGWSDVGDWDGLGRLLTQDDHGNSGNAFLNAIGATNCVVWSETSRLIALIGVEGLAVVDTADALLVTKREHAQSVKQLVETLKNQAIEVT